MKIIPVFNLGGASAGYNLLDGNIYYDARLDKYPALKDKILEHEKTHEVKKDKIWIHVWLDMKDYFLLFMRKDFFEYAFMQKDLVIPKKTLKQIVIYFLLSPISMVLGLISLLVGTFCFIFYHSRRKVK